MHLKKIALLIVLYCAPFSMYAQYKFEHHNASGSNSIEVIENSIPLKLPFTGGFKLPQFTECDLNFDGIMDLVVFDREASKISTFINKGTQGKIDYEYAPEYQKYFPEINYWMVMVDYNYDGKNDIFCAHPSGVSIYKNTGNSNTGLSFALIEDVLYIEITQGRTNLPLEISDIPAILDIDGDGDIDILGFYNAQDSVGDNVYWYKNRSMEKYSVADSLDFHIAKYCWGQFKESFFNCEIIINYPTGVCGAGQRSNTIPTQRNNKHAGSTLLVFDANFDGKNDILIGDFTCENMTLLINGATNTEAIMTQKIENYPSDRPIDLAIFPAAYYIDVNNDGLKDLISAPNIAGGSINNHHVLLYLNDGSNNLNNFQFQTDQFLLDQMVDVGDGAAPAFVDYNNDGLVDIVVSNTYYLSKNNEIKTGLALLKNIGTEHKPKYDLITRDWFGFSTLNIYNMNPSFADLDNDGDIDMVCGAQDGSLHFFRNTAPPNTEMNLQFVSNYFGNIDVGNLSAPFVYDINNDGNKEILVGEQSFNINLVSNTGTVSNPSYVLTTDSLYKINLKKYNPYYFGRAKMLIEKINPNETEKIIISNGNGILYFFDSPGTNINQNIGSPTDSLDLHSGYYSFAYGGFPHSIADIDGDTDKDMVVGTPQGGLYLYRNTELNVGVSTANSKKPFKVYPNPTKDFIQIKANENSSLSIIKLSDVKGTILYEENRSNGHAQIDIRNLADGIYLLSVQTLNGVYNEKVIVQK